jgi:hypothetical protein
MLKKLIILVAAFGLIAPAIVLAADPAPTTASASKDTKVTKDTGSKKKGKKAAKKGKKDDKGAAAPK